MRVLLFLIASSFLLSSILPNSIVSLDALAAKVILELDGKSKVKIIHGTSRVFSHTSLNVLHVSPNKQLFIQDDHHPGILRSADQVERIKKINVKIIRPKPIGLIASVSPQQHDITSPEVVVAERDPIVQIFKVYVIERHPPLYRFQRYTGFKKQYFGQRYTGFQYDTFGPRYLQGSY